VREIIFDGDGLSNDCPLYGEITIQECRECPFNAGIFDDFSEDCDFSETILSSFVGATPTQDIFKER